MKRPTITSDWTRCKTYALRVRRLGFGGSYDPEPSIRIAPDIITAMDQYQVLPLPNLRAYRCQDTLVPTGPGLLKFEIDYTSHKASCSPMSINSLRTSSPFIEKIALWADSPSVIPPEFGALVVHFSRLTSLSISDCQIPDNALRILFSSLIIRHLKIGNTSEDILRCLPHRGSILPELENFAFSTGYFGECSDILHRLDPRKLQSIAVWHKAKIAKLPIKESHIRKFFPGLKAHCTTSVLTSVRLHQELKEPESITMTDEIVCTMDTFEPLICFRNLNTLDLLTYETKYDLDNKSIEKMTISWPKIELFNLVSTIKRTEEYQLRITLDGLVLMAKNWPHLGFLGLSFAGRALDGDASIHLLGAGLSCVTLKCMDAGYSSLDSDPGLVASFLTTIFPNLWAIMSNNTSWISVRSAMKAMKEARKQEGKD